MIPRFLEGSTSHHGSIAAPSLEILQGIPVEETLEMTTSPFYFSNFVHIPGEIAHPATIAKLTEFNSLLFRISANFFNGEINSGYTKLLQLELDTMNPIFLLEKLDFIYKREYLFWYYPDYHHWYTFWYSHIFGEINSLKTPMINSPLEQFAIIPLIPMKIGDLYFSFTNSSLFMLLTLSLVLLFVYFVTKKGDSSVKILSGKEGMMDKIKPNLMKILRPLSPHLPIYKPQLTSTFSIFNRISGTFLATIVFFFSLLCLKMAFLCFTYSSFYQFFFYSSKLITCPESFWTSLLGPLFFSFILTNILSFFFLFLIMRSSSLPPIYRGEKEDFPLISLSIFTTAAILLILEAEAMPIAFATTPLEGLGTRGGPLFAMDGAAGPSRDQPAPSQPGLQPAPNPGPSLELKLGPPGVDAGPVGEASLPSLNDLPTIVYEQQLKIPGNNSLTVELEQNELASLINQLPKQELKKILNEDSIQKPLNAFSAERQERLIDLAIRHFSLKNQIIEKMKNLYPNEAWEFTQIVREKFFDGRQKGREYSLEELQKMLSALNENGKRASCASRLHSNIRHWNWKE